MFIDQVGGRKNVLGYAFIVCTTFLVYAMLLGTHEPDYVGMASVIGAIAAGVGMLVWGNVKEHQAKANGNGNGTVKPTS